MAARLEGQSNQKRRPIGKACCQASGQRRMSRRELSSLDRCKRTCKLCKQASQATTRGAIRLPKSCKQLPPLKAAPTSPTSALTSANTMRQRAACNGGRGGNNRIKETGCAATAEPFKPPNLILMILVLAYWSLAAAASSLSSTANQQESSASSLELVGSSSSLWQLDRPAATLGSAARALPIASKVGAPGFSTAAAEATDIGGETSETAVGEQQWSDLRPDGQQAVRIGANSLLAPEVPMSRNLVALDLTSIASENWPAEKDRAASGNSEQQRRQKLAGRRERQQAGGSKKRSRREEEPTHAGHLLRKPPNKGGHLDTGKAVVAASKQGGEEHDKPLLADQDVVISSSEISPTDKAAAAGGAAGWRQAQFAANTSSAARSAANSIAEAPGLDLPASSERIQLQSEQESGDSPELQLQLEPAEEAGETEKATTGSHGDQAASKAAVAKDAAVTSRASTNCSTGAGTLTDSVGDSCNHRQQQQQQQLETTATTSSNKPPSMNAISDIGSLGDGTNFDIRNAGDDSSNESQRRYSNSRLLLRFLVVGLFGMVSLSLVVVYAIKLCVCKRRKRLLRRDFVADVNQAERCREFLLASSSPDPPGCSCLFDPALVRVGHRPPQPAPPTGSGLSLHCASHLDLSGGGPSHGQQAFMAAPSSLSSCQLAAPSPPMSPQLQLLQSQTLATSQTAAQRHSASNRLQSLLRPPTGGLWGGLCRQSAPGGAQWAARQTVPSLYQQLAIAERFALQQLAASAAHHQHQQQQQQLQSALMLPSASQQHCNSCGLLMAHSGETAAEGLPGCTLGVHNQRPPAYSDIFGHEQQQALGQSGAISTDQAAIGGGSDISNGSSVSSNSGTSSNEISSPTTTTTLNSISEHVVITNQQQQASQTTRSSGGCFGDQDDNEDPGEGDDQEQLAAEAEDAVCELEQLLPLPLQLHGRNNRNLLVKLNLNKTKLLSADDLVLLSKLIDVPIVVQQQQQSHHHPQQQHRCEFSGESGGADLVGAARSFSGPTSESCRNDEHSAAAEDCAGMSYDNERDDNDEHADGANETASLR